MYFFCKMNHQSPTLILNGLCPSLTSLVLRVRCLPLLNQLGSWVGGRQRRLRVALALISFPAIDFLPSCLCILMRYNLRYNSVRTVLRTALEKGPSIFDKLIYLIYHVCTNNLYCFVRQKEQNNFLLGLTFWSSRRFVCTQKNQNHTRYDDF